LTGVGFLFQNKTTMENKLLQFQKAIGVIAKDSKNPHFKNTYASLTQILSEVKPVLTTLGLVLLQPINNGKVGTIILDGTTTIAESWIDLPLNLQPQPLGSAITYFRRYTLSSLLALEIDDDDAQSAKPAPVKPTLNATQFESMIKAINEGKKLTVEAAMNNYTISPEHLTALKLALKNN
jgi:hypothetical protein